MSDYWRVYNPDNGVHSREKYPDRDTARAEALRLSANSDTFYQVSSFLGTTEETQQRLKQELAARTELKATYLVYYWDFEYPGKENDIYCDEVDRSKLAKKLENLKKNRWNFKVMKIETTTVFTEHGETILLGDGTSPSDGKIICI
jgi:hypothetical protein